jgi:hypothetical protein
MRHPVGFSEAELDVITDAAWPIHPALRAEFVEAVSTGPMPHRVLGEGLVHRSSRDLQQRFIIMSRAPRRGNVSRAWRS